MKIFGHRGAAGLVLENTTASVRKALALGVDGVEFDVRITQDHVPVVLHDESLERTHQIAAKLADLTWLQVQEQVGQQTSQAERAIPSLNDVLNAIQDECEKIGRDGVVVNVEMKEIAAVLPSLDVLTRLSAAGVIVPDDILITAFDHDAVSLVREHTEHFKVGLLTRHLPEEAFWSLAESLDAYSVNISKDAINEDFVKRAHTCGRQVMVYTVNSPSEAKKLASWNVDAIFSDDPHLIRQ